MNDTVGACVRKWWLGVAGAILAACTTGTVVLLPEKDGRPAAVSVRQGDKEVVLDTPYAAAKTTALGPRPYSSSAQDVEAQFGSAIAAQPIRPTSFTLNFVEGRDELTEEAKDKLGKILAEIAQRPVPDVLVVGHTDAVGSDEYNDKLAQRRADKVRDLLITDLHISPTDIRAISRGKRELAVPTGDGVAEPLNRRVQIFVR